MSVTPARLAYNNLLTASGVVITSSADATGYPVTNLSNSARWKKWRSSTTTGDQWVLFDLGSNQSFQLLALTDVLLHTGGGTLKFQANATNVWTSPTVSDTMTLPSPDFTHVVADWISQQTLRYIRFYFTNVGASNSYVEIGAAVAAPYFQAAQSIAPGVSVVRHDQSIDRLSLGGQRSSIVRGKYHEITGTFKIQSTTDRDAWRTAFDTNGATAPCVFAVDPGVPSLNFYGVMRPAPTASGRTVLSTFKTVHHHPSDNLWDVDFVFQEDVS